MVGFAVLAFAAALLVGASAVARSLAARALGANGSTWWLINAPFRWTTHGAARWLAVVAASALSSYAIVALLAATGLVLSGTDRPDEKSMRVQVGPNGPAASAGVRDGDRVVAVGALQVADWDTLKREIRAHAAQPIVLTVERGAGTLHIDVTPNDEGKILIGPATITERPTPGVAVREGLTMPPKVWLATLRGLARVFAPREPDNLAGPVGIVRETDRAAERSGIGRALVFAAALAAYAFPMMVLYAMIVTPLKKSRAGARS